jgi:coproporphyrinogen III oxidase
MKNQFDLKNFLGTKRETIIEKYNQMTTHVFYANQISLRDFGIQVYSACIRNGINSEKIAANKFAFILGNIVSENTQSWAQVAEEREFAAKYPRINN